MCLFDDGLLLTVSQVMQKDTIAFCSNAHVIYRILELQQAADDQTDMASAIHTCDLCARPCTLCTQPSTAEAL